MFHGTYICARDGGDICFVLNGELLYFDQSFMLGGTFIKYTEQLSIQFYFQRNKI